MRILNVKDEAVTQGVLDKNVTVQPDQVEVTYTDILGTPHTIFYHKDGPFGSPEEAAQAHADGLLHPHADEQPQPETPPPPAGPVIE